MGIYKEEDRLRRALNVLQASGLSETKKREICDFVETLRAEGIGPLRLTSYVQNLARIGELLATESFTAARKQDIIKAMSRFEAQGYSETTKQNHKATLKRFYKGLKGGGEEYPPEVKWIKTTLKNNNHKLPEDLLTPEEVNQLAQAATSPRDKALIQVLYESGGRVGEILPLKIRHVQFDEHGAVLMVSGKTGGRRVRLIASAPILSQWMENHPLKGDPEAPLWVGIGTKSHLKALSYEALRKILFKTAKRAGVKKRVNPHSFRHSRSSHLAKILTEAQMKQHLGWTQGSKMAAVYVHLSGRDVDSTLLKAAGVQVNEEEEAKEKFQLQICARCKEKNSPASSFCQRCGSPLTLKASFQVEEHRAKADDIMNWLIEDPEVKAILARKIVEWQLNTGEAWPTPPSRGRPWIEVKP